MSDEETPEEAEEGQEAHEPEEPEAPEAPEEKGGEPAAPAPEAEPPRRNALKVLAVAGGCAYAGALAIPSIPFLVSSGADEGAATDDAGNWFRLAKLESLEEGKPARFKITGDEHDAFTLSKDRTLGSVWLIRRGEAVTALSAECPHLGCSIDATADGAAFSCPCHTSKFTLEGKPETGPSPRPMDELATRLTEGWVEVDFQRFRQGTEEQVALG